MRRGRRPGQNQGVMERAMEIGGDSMSRNPMAEKVSPGELAERSRPLCETSGAAQRAGQAPKGVIAQPVEGGWDVTKRLA